MIIHFAQNISAEPSGNAYSADSKLCLVLQAITVYDAALDRSPIARITAPKENVY